MAKVENTSFKNTYGDGYKQKVTLDNGDQYIVENTSFKNTYGDGYKQKVTKTDNLNNYSASIEDLIAGLVGIAFLVGLLALLSIIM